MDLYVKNKKRESCSLREMQLPKRTVLACTAGLSPSALEPRWQANQMPGAPGAVSRSGIRGGRWCRTTSGNRAPQQRINVYCYTAPLKGNGRLSPICLLSAIMPVCDVTALPLSFSLDYLSILLPRNRPYRGNDGVCLCERQIYLSCPTYPLHFKGRVYSLQRERVNAHTVPQHHSSLRKLALSVPQHSRQGDCSR